jgi:hypothetical protein
MDDLVVGFLDGKWNFLDQPLIYMDEKNDLALLKITRNYGPEHPVVEVMKTDPVLGDRLFAVENRGENTAY